MKIFRNILVFLSLFGATLLCAQPANDQCNTAASITFNGSTGCVSGTLQNADDDLTNFPAGPQCPTPNRGNEVWYTFTATNSLAIVRLIGTNYTNPHVNVFVGNDCLNLNLIACAEGNTNDLQLEVATNPGNTYLVTVSDGNINQGAFTLCIENSNVVSSPGNICTEAVNICSKEPLFVKDTEAISSSGTFPSCFEQGGVPIAVVRDSWIKFTVTKSGTFEFAVFPTANTQEIDFALYDITNGCPGNLLSCNYSFSRGLNVTSPTGIWNDPSVFPNPDEFNNPINVVQGRTYALLIDNYQGNPDGFDLYWSGTFDMSTKADFRADQIFGCEPFTAIMQDNSIGADSYTWTFPDGSTSNAKNPSYFFNAAGEQNVQLDVSNNRNNCISSFSSRFVVNQLKFNNSIQDSSICLGNDIQFTNTIEFTDFQGPVNFEFEGNQTFSSGNALNDFGQVRNIFPFNYQSGDLQEVCISLRHGDLSEVAVDLISPSGTRLVLISSGDLQGQRITKLCFNPNSPAAFATAVAPYEQNVKPKNDFDLFLDDPKEGIWTLNVRDENNNPNIGLFSFWSLQFRNSNEATVVWSPSIYLNNDSILNPFLSSPAALLENELVTYKINVSDFTTCKDSSVSQIGINISSFAGSDSALYFCEDLSEINLFDILSDDATQDGQWFDANDTQVDKFFNPLDFTGQTVTRKYKIIGAAAECGLDSAEFILQVRPDTSISYNFPDEICATEPFQIDLNSNLQGFVQFFGSYSGMDTSIILNNFPNSFSATANQLPFSIDSLTFDDGQCTLPTQKIINPDLIDSPELILDSTVCNPTSTSYVAYLTVIGGETATLEVNGQNASTRKVVSAPITSGQDFLFECSDGNACGIDSLRVNVRCDCNSRAGTLNNNQTNSICDTDTLKIIHNQDQVEDPDDISEYIISAAPFPNGGIVTRGFYTSELALFFAPPYQANTDYYITYVTGTKDANQRVDLQDPCLSSTNSVLFRFSESPKGRVFLGQNLACINAPVPINFNLNAGTPDFTFFRNGEAIFTSTTFNGSFNISFAQDTVFFIDSVLSANGCFGYNFPKDSARINIVDFPEFTDVQFSCDNIAENFTLNFTLTGGDASSYDVSSNIDLNNNGKNYQSTNTIASGLPLSIQASDDNMCATSILDTVYNCPCISRAPTLLPFANNGLICEGDSLYLNFLDADNDQQADGRVLDPNDEQSIMVVEDLSDTALRPIPFVYYGPKTGFLSSDFDLETDYHIFAVVGNPDANGRVLPDARCSQFSNAAAFKVSQKALLNTLSLEADSICEGETLDFTANNSGAFSLDISIENTSGTETFNLVIPPGNSNHSLVPSQSGLQVYFVSSINDQSSAACSGLWQGDSLRVFVNAAPEIIVNDNSDLICIGESYVLDYTVNSSANVNLDVFFNNQQISSQTANPGSNTFEFTPTENGNIELRNVQSAVGNSQCIGSVNQGAIISLHDALLIDLTQDPLNPCVGESVDINIFANKSNYTLYYQDIIAQSVNSNGSQSRIQRIQNNPSDALILDSLVSSDQSTQSLNFCTYAIDSAITIEGLALPSLSIQPLFNNPICENDYAVFNYTLTGQSPFTVNLEIDGNAATLNSSGNNFLDSVRASNQNINYRVLTVSDAHCKAPVDLDFNIVPTPAAIADVSIESDNLCEPANIKAENLTPNLSSCEWTNTDGEVISTDCEIFIREEMANANLSYGFSYRDLNGCFNQVQSNTLSIARSPIAAFEFSPERPNTTNPDIQMRNLSAQFDRSEWFVNEKLKSTENDPVIRLTPSTDILNDLLLVVSAINGCSDSAHMQLRLAPNLAVYIPSAFSPDGDGINDCFSVIGSGAADQGFILQIFNRWGEEVYQSTDINDCWDGRYKGELLPSAMYSLKLRIFNSTLEGFEDHYGKVTLLR